jgi:hypothetical protein
MVEYQFLFLFFTSIREELLSILEDETILVDFFNYCMRIHCQRGLLEAGFLRFILICQASPLRLHR